MAPVFPGYNPEEDVRRTHGHELERLVAMQQQVSHGYFRLLAAYRGLRALRKDAPPGSGALVAEALERERKRIADELHSGVGQALVGIHLQLDVMQNLLAEPPMKIRESMHSIETLTQSALDLVRGISRRMYAQAWQALPLSAAVRELWDNSGVPEKFGGTLELEEITSDLPLAVRTVLYRTAQEALSNAVRHSGARHLRLALREENGRVSLEVQDDGHGFDLERTLSQPAGAAGIGLRSMHDMAREHDGTLRIESGPQGTKLTLSFQVNP